MPTSQILGNVVKIFQKNKKDKKKHLRIEDKFKPLWLQFWDKVNAKCKTEKNENFKFKNNLFTMMCRDHFDTLEPYARARKQIVIPLKVFNKRQSEDSVLAESDRTELTSPPGRNRQRLSESQTELGETQTDDQSIPLVAQAQSLLPRDTTERTLDSTDPPNRQRKRKRREKTRNR